MDNIMDRAEKVFRTVVLILFGIFTGYLLLISLFSTCYYSLHEPRAFVSDSPVKVLAVYVLLSAGAYFLAKKKWLIKWERYQKHFFYGLIICVNLFLIYFILGTQLEPHGDQLAIFNAAEGLNKYDFSLFAKGTYFDYYPFQSRIVVFLWGFSKLMGNSNYLAFQMLNAAAITVSLVFLAGIWKITADMSGMEKNLVLAASMMFLPYLMYVTYLYGNLIGFAFVIAAVYFEIKYLQSHRKRWLLLSILLCGIGIWLKNTYLVMMVAMIVFLLLDVFRKRKWFSAAGIFAFIFSALFWGWCSDTLLERHIDMELSEGSPMVAWITMAFGEDEDGVPVTFDGYNMNVYLDNGGDTEAARKAAEKRLVERLAELMEDPMHFLSFMAKKISLQWNEPTFESIVANNRAYSQIEEPKLIKAFLVNDNRNFAVKAMNLFHGLVLMGCVTWVLLKGRKEKTENLFPALIFIGGFLFQLFWESLAQYALIYFLLLIPYAVRGYLCFGEELAFAEGKKKAGKTVFPLGMFLLLIVGVWLADGEIWNNTVKLHMDDEAYTQRLHQIQEEEKDMEKVLEDGYYRISPAASPEWVLTLSGGQAAAGPQTQGADEGIFNVHHEYGFDMLRFKQSQKLLSVSGDPGAEGTVVGADFDNAMWRIAEDGQGGYYILYQKTYALSCEKDTGKVLLEPFHGGKQQTWFFQQTDD